MEISRSPKSCGARQSLWVEWRAPTSRRTLEWHIKRSSRKGIHIRYSSIICVRSSIAPSRNMMIGNRRLTWEQFSLSPSPCLVILCHIDSRFLTITLLASPRRTTSNYHRVRWLKLCWVCSLYSGFSITTAGLEPREKSYEELIKHLEKLEVSLPE